MTKITIDDDTESSSSRASEFSPSPGRRRRLKVEEVYCEVLQRLQESEYEEAYRPDFIDELWNHFQRLPLRYALDVNIEKAHDVLMHKKLLDLARDPNTRPAFEVRFVQVHPFDGNADDTVHSSLAYIRDNENYRLHPPPTFNALSTSELKSEENKLLLLHSNNSVSGKSQSSRPLHEVTISTNDKPKLLTRLTALLSEVGLNIQEAHAFSTSDGYSLDVFLVDGWTNEEADQLISVLEKEIPKIELEENKIEYLPGQGSLPTEGCGDWEIDAKLVKFKQKIATGSNGDLYRGAYCGQDVAVKVLNTENLNDKIQKEFAQEVYILRKVRHKNVVQFIGACTRPPRLCIVTEYMRGGSIYDYLRKQKGVLKLPAVLKVSLDVARGMSYLHQNNIVHRDLKTANLLMDENDVVKVADFGVAKVQVQSGVMTAETGTYRWMAPEVIEHKPYNHKVDVFSYSIVLWELLTGKLPYEHMTPLQAAVGVVQQGLRPDIPSHADPLVVELLERCWHQDPNLRPEFSEIIEILQRIPIRHEERTSKRRSVRGRQPF